MVAVDGVDGRAEFVVPRGKVHPKLSMVLVSALSCSEGFRVRLPTHQQHKLLVVDEAQIVRA